MMQVSSFLLMRVLLIDIPHIMGGLGQSMAARPPGRHSSATERGK